MIIRWLIGYRGGHCREAAEACLELSQDLMRQLEPKAEFYVFYHKRDGCPSKRRVDTYYMLTSGNALGETWEKFIPTRIDATQHEVYMDNDHIMWALPPAWLQFKERQDAALVYRTNDWGYHGSFTNKLGDCFFSSGLYGLPPKVTLNIQTGVVDGNGLPLVGANHDQEEMGAMSWAFKQEFKDEQLLRVWMATEVPVYVPEPHDPFMGGRVWGTCGVHLSGANRGHFDPMPTLTEIRSKYVK